MRKNIKAAGCLYFSLNTARYLFLQRTDKKYNNSWGMVGGKLQGNESFIDGLIRETKEEIGFVPVVQKFIPLEKFTSDDLYFEYVTFIATTKEEFIPRLNKEHKGYCWTKIESFPKPLHPGLFNTIRYNTFKEKIQTLETTLL